MIRGTKRLVVTMTVPALLLGLYGCSRFKAMYVCMRSKAEDSDVSLDDAAKMAKGGKAGLVKGAKGELAGMTAEGEDGAAGSGKAGAAAGGTAADGSPASGAAGSGAAGSAAGGTGDAASAKPTTAIGPGGLVVGALMKGKKLTLMGEISGDRVKMIKASNDDIYIFFYDGAKRDVAEGFESEKEYDVMFRVRGSCPGEADICGDLVTAEEH